jgi:hypothetical protein
MTREEAIKIIQNEYKCVDRECDIERSCGKCPYMIPTKEPILQAYEMAIQALSQEPCDDAISREDVQDYIAKYLSQYLYEDVRQAVEVIDAYIGDMPSVTQKSGKWIDDEFGSKCSCCGIHTHLDKFDRPMKFKYCSMCGAKMESEG